MPESDPPAGALTYDPELGPGYFVQTRADFLRHEGFSPTVTRLYQVLLTYCGAGDTAWPGQDRLARECGGLSVPTIRKALDELIAAGLVTETRRGLNRTNLYHVHKLPLVLPMRDTKNIAIRSKKSLGTRIKVPRPKVQSEQIESVETGIDPALVNAIRTWAYQHRARLTEAQIAALAGAAGTLARWQAVSAGAPDWAAVQRALGEG